MDRQEAIQHIEALYPADSGYEDTAEIGQRLLRQAKRESNIGWQDEPDAVLIRYAELCIEEENRQAQKILSA